MKTSKLERFQAAGWKVGSAEDFLQLSDDEAQLVALKHEDLQGIAGKSFQEIVGLEFPALETRNTTSQTVTNG